MARKYDYTGVPQTCPKIDTVIRYVNQIKFDGSDDDLFDYENERKEVIEVLEQIRSANDSLRVFANCTFEEKDEFEQERDLLEKQVKELQSEISDLNAEVSKLETKVEELEDTLLEYK